MGSVALKMASSHKGTQFVSDIGNIPADWKVECIEDFASITTGSRNTQDNIADGVFPFFIRSQTIERINSFSFDCEATITAGDGVGTGKVFHYIKGKFDAHQRVYVITDFRNDISGYFFFLFFSTNFYRRVMQMTAKSSVDSVRREMISRMPVALPPTREEQEAIAEALSDADGLIEQLEQLIAKKRAIKQGAMQELLTGKKRLSGFKARWASKTLGELGSFSKGSGIKKDQVLSDGLCCIRYGEIYTHHDDYIRKFYSYISFEVARSSQKIKTGALLFAGSGETAEEIGKCVAYLGNDAVYAGGDIVIFNPTESDSLYLAYLMNSRSLVQQKSRMAQGDAVVHISARNLASLRFDCPDINEQIAIAAVLSGMDSEISSLEEKLAKARAIKSGMMHELLTGKTRLV